MTVILELSGESPVSATAEMPERSLAFSAPGKVLFTGGFLVLDRKHQGLVLGLDARIHVHVQDLDTKQNGVRVLVRSPQFHNASWLYEVDPTAIDTPRFVHQITE